MDDSEQKLAQPGDAIIITEGRSSLLGRLLVVVDAPTGDEKCNPYPGDAWVMNDGLIPQLNKTRILFLAESYKIVRRGMSPDTDKNVDVSLEKQRDHNLRSIFG